MKGDETPVTGGVPLPDYLVYKEPDMAKSPEMTESLDKVSLEWFGRSRTECIKNGTCVICGGEAKSFDDLIARKEFGISGMCQKCQDETFAD